MNTMKRTYLVAASLLAVVWLVATAANAGEFTEHLLSNRYDYAYGLTAGDLNADGKPEVVSADAVANNLTFYLNQGTGRFSRKTIDQNETGLLERSAIGDLDGDGRPDVAVVKNRPGALQWYENPGGNSTGTWTQHTIAADYPRAYDVCLSDLNGDGRLDVAASSYVGGSIAWFENPNSGGSWKKHSLATDIGETRTIREADFNDDGRPDLLGTSRTGHKVLWYENPGQPETQQWPAHVIDDSSPAPTHGQPVDLDGDDDQDVVMALGYRVASRYGQVVWYENRDAGASWRKHVIGDLPYAFEAVVGDVNGDGKPDVVATAFTTGTNGEHVVWFENPGDPTRAWIKHVLKSNWYGANSVILVDLDGDGRLDIVASAENVTKEVRWWHNEITQAPR